jgi:hypothetical protein
MSIVGMLLIGFAVQFGMGAAGILPGQCNPANMYHEYAKNCPEPETKQIWPTEKEGESS